MQIRAVQKLIDAMALEACHGQRPLDLRAEVDVLEALLEGSVQAKKTFLRGFSSRAPPTTLPRDLLARVEALTPRVWDATIPDKKEVEAGLLQHLAYTASPSSLPVFLRAIEFTKPRDQLGAARKEWAVAGIALLSHRRNDATARDAHEALLSHPDPRVSAPAVDALAEFERKKDGRLTAAGARQLEAAAVDARTFEARLLARVALLEDRRALPLEESGEVYQATVTFGGATRTLELLASATLTDLASEAVSALRWDHDHLWGLFLSDRVEHPTLRVSPEGDPWAAEELMSALTLDEVGFPAGHKLKMLYDYGDHNIFSLQIVGRVPRKPGVKYPRVVAKKGSAPKQYPSW